MTSTLFVGAGGRKPPRRLPAAATLAAALLLPALAWGQVSLNGTGTYRQEFDILASSGTTGSDLPPGWAFVETGSAANTTYGVGDGTSGTGNTYSYGRPGSGERALGTLRGGNGLASTIGASFRNDGSTVITGVLLRYNCEAWRIGSASGVDKLVFEYSTDATSLTTGTWTPYSLLDGMSPGGFSPGLPNGAFSSSNGLFSLTVPVGGTFWIRWTHPDANPYRDGLAVDDLTLTATFAPEIDLRQGSTSLGSGTGSYAFGSVAPGASTDATFTVANTAPPANSTLTLSGTPHVALSGPNAGEFSVTTQPADIVIGGSSTTFVVRFQPSSAGPKAATVTLANDDPNEGSYTFALTGTAPAPLPVQLVAFTARPAGPAAVALAWTTASELHSARFEVQRSLDGRTFEPVGTVAAAGSSSSARHYQHLDATAPAGTRVYYRLRQVDHDGTAAYSPVRAVTLAGDAGLVPYPNPTHGPATVSGLPAGTAVQVLDALGRPVLHARADEAGQATLALPAGLAPGLYLVRAGTQVARLLVE